MAQRSVVELSSKLKGKTVEVVSLNFTDHLITHKLENLGFIKGARIKVLDNDDSKQVLHLQLMNVQYVLREESCHLIHVEVIETVKA